MKLRPDALPVVVMRGALIGAAATVPMSAVMLAAQRVGIYHRHPPEEITEDALRAAAAQPDEAELDVASSAAHLGFGAAAGVIWELLLLNSVLRRVPLALSSVVFGLTVWLVSYAGWVPALNIMPPPQRDEPGRPVSMAAAHVVFGAGLALGHRLLRRR